jgi:hypothetical protein
MKVIAEKNYKKAAFPAVALILCLFSVFGNPAVAGHNKFFTSIDGWEDPEEVDVYSPETLWDIINGAADVFMAYDFQELYWGEYINSADNTVYIVMEIYRQGDPVNAFGVYSQERPRTPQLIDIGVQGYTAPGVLHFFVADCYVKIRSHDRSEDTARAMEKMAKHVSDLLDPDPGFPDIVTMLPEEGRIEYSEEYINTNFLGHPFLSRAFVSSYDIDGNRFNLFIIKNKTREEGEKILTDYYKFSGQEIKDPGEGTHRIDDRWNGEIGIVWKGNILYGYYNLDDKELQEKYLEFFSGS